MKNLKPSQLPENTVIETEYGDEYIKRANGVWEEFESNELGDRHRVTDMGYDESEDYALFLRRTGLASKKKSDDYFKEYRVVASDPGFHFSEVSLHGAVVNSRFFEDGTRMHVCWGYNCEA